MKISIVSFHCDDKSKAVCTCEDGSLPPCKVIYQCILFNIFMPQNLKLKYVFENDIIKIRIEIWKEGVFMQYTNWNIDMNMHYPYSLNTKIQLEILSGRPDCFLRLPLQA